MAAKCTLPSVTASRTLRPMYSIPGWVMIGKAMRLSEPITLSIHFFMTFLCGLVGCVQELLQQLDVLLRIGGVAVGADLRGELG